ncbi:MAG: hypothetical protein K9G40_03630 [Crocinitomicaceae bacterium]|nr:hypothetical protein [Crocinitomicaceae bacterium]MCF8434993.1 hypothetical protein [Crocinitomicaceae bacterium]
MEQFLLVQLVHNYPLLYSLGLREEKDAISFFNDEPMAGSLTMTSVKIG